MKTIIAFQQLLSQFKQLLNTEALKKDVKIDKNGIQIVSWLEDFFQLIQETADFMETRVSQVLQDIAKLRATSTQKEQNGAINKLADLPTANIINALESYMQKFSSMGKSTKYSATVSSKHSDIMSFYQQHKEQIKTECQQKLNNKATATKMVHGQLAETQRKGQSKIASALMSVPQFITQAMTASPTPIQKKLLRSPKSSPKSSNKHTVPTYAAPRGLLDELQRAQTRRSTQPIISAELQTKTDSTFSSSSSAKIVIPSPHTTRSLASATIPPSTEYASPITAVSSSASMISPIPFTASSTQDAILSSSNTMDISSSLTHNRYKKRGRDDHSTTENTPVKQSKNELFNHKLFKARKSQVSQQKQSITKSAKRTPHHT